MSMVWPGCGRLLRFATISLLQLPTTRMLGLSDGKENPLYA